MTKALLMKTLQIKTMYGVCHKTSNVLLKCPSTTFSSRLTFLKYEITLSKRICSDENRMFQDLKVILCLFT